MQFSLQNVWTMSTLRAPTICRATKRDRTLDVRFKGVIFRKVFEKLKLHVKLHVKMESQLNSIFWKVVFL
jgi:hypothetical protein